MDASGLRLLALVLVIMALGGFVLLRRRKRAVVLSESNRVAASALMRRWMEYESMEAPARARQFLDDFARQWPFTAEARQLFRTIGFEAADLSQEHGGGYWHPDARTVQVRGSQAEALIHELAHAYWEDARRADGIVDGLVDGLQRLAEERDPKYEQAATLARHYVHGIPTQPDPDSPTGYWQGMRQADGTWMDWEIFAGLASGIMANILLLPPYLRPYFAGLFEARTAAAPAGPGNQSAPAERARGEG